jgi:hypothetical protein
MKTIVRLQSRDHPVACGTPALILIVLAASIVITLLFWSILPARMSANESADYVSFYEPVARNLLAGHGPVTNDGTAAVRYPPGYPLLLAGVFGLANLTGLQESVVLSTFTLLCTVLSAILVLLLARTLWQPLPSVFVSLIWITYPIALWSTKQPNSEIPFIPLLYGAFLLAWSALLRNRLDGAIALISGVILGFAMLVRPLAIGVGLIMAIVIWISYRNANPKHRLFLSTMLLVGNLIAILPWEAWAYANTRQVILLSTGGIPSVRDGLTFAANKLRYREGVAVPADVEELSRDILDRSRDLRTSEAIVSLVAAETKTNPVAMAKLLIIKAARSWYATDSNRLETPILVIQLLYLPLVIWGSWIVRKRGGMPQKMTIAIWLTVCYFWGMTTLVLSIVRYLLPVMGLLFLLLPGILSKKYALADDSA